MSIYRRFCKETFDDTGRLVDFRLDVPEGFNFAYDVLDALADETPDARALVWCDAEGHERTFGFLDMRRECDRAANVFRSAGIAKGDRVMLILKRHFEYWPCVLALCKLGAVAIPATHMLTVSDLAYRIQAANVRAIVCTPTGHVPGKVKSALRETGRDALLWTVRESVPGFSDMTSQMADAPDTFARIPTRATDPMLLYFTSGTTGQPKGVIHDHAYPLAHIVTAKYWQRAEEGGLHLSIAETGWAKASWGKLYGQWLVGSAVMVYDFDSFDPRAVAAVVARYGVTSFCAPPTFYRYLVRKGVPAMPGLKQATTAGETLAPDVFAKFFEATGVRLREGYGQTETTLLTANFTDEDSTPGSMGVPSPLYRIDLTDGEGRPVACGEIGEVVIRCDDGARPCGVFAGYLEDDERYETAFRDGAYHTGDAAYRDPQGRYYFHGRFDDVIKTCGYRVGPSEIEHVLAAHPAVADCCVIGVPDAARGRAIMAVVVPVEGAKADGDLARDVREFCNRRLAEYKWVRSVRFMTALPKTISGKVIKRVVSECMCGGL